MRETERWRSGVVRRILISSLVPLAAIVAVGVCFAMPAARGDDGLAAALRPETTLTTPIFNDPATDQYTPYQSLFDQPLAKGAPPFRVKDDRASIPLTPEERDRLRNMLGRPGDMALGNSDPGLPGGDSSNGQRQVEQIVADMNSLYAEKPSNGLNAERNGAGGGATGRAGGGTAPVLRVIRTPRNEDLPVLSAIPVGTLFVETVKSLVDNGAIDRSFASELRDFALVNQPATGSLMMVDGNSNYTFMLVSPKFAKDVIGHPNASPREPRTERHMKVLVSSTHRPLLAKIWDIATSLGAFVFYGIALVCWGAWRYLISRYA